MTSEAFWFSLSWFVHMAAPFKILWYSLPCLLDTSSGAAIRCKLMLERLHALGIEVKILCGSITDSPSGLAHLENLKRNVNFPALQYPATDDAHCFLQFTLDGIEYFIHRTADSSTANIKASEQSQIFNIYCQILEQYQPDMVMGYSGDVFSSMLRREAHERGISVVYALCNGSHLTFGFKDCDLAFTTSQATCDYYAERAGVKVYPVGNFIEPAKVVASPAQRQPRYITLINPDIAKGLSIFVKLALAYTQRHPEAQQRFLVVKSRGSYEQNLMALHHADGTPFLQRPTDGSNRVETPLGMIDVCEHTDHIEAVYGLTKVVVAPSLWHESWGRVVTEANLNGIPVLVTQNGGLLEAMGNGLGGIALPIPKSCQKDMLCLPTDEEIAPYVDALERLLNEDWSEGCAKASEINSIDRSVDRLYQLILPWLQKGQENKKPFGPGSGYFNERYLQSHADVYQQQQERRLQQQQSQQQQQQQQQPQQ